ncbi:MAG: M6 family metalloprotease domain-containing protein, partial [Candidatus Latescibacteria bacterium]|nr:M6 family metalloprotease domain-containing protein [Candidatus Latescibacterota bacterium]
MKTTCLVFLLNLLCLTAASARPVALSEPVSGVRHALVIFAKFRDEAASDTAPEWAKDLFNRQLPGSLSHFYAEMSFGQFTLDGAVLPKRYASDHSAEYYGDEEYGAFNREILTKVDREVDFSEYDNDGPDGVPNSGDDDGYVDMVFINLNSRPKRFYDAELEDATGIALLGLSEDFITDDPNTKGAFIRIGKKSGATQWVWSFTHAVGSMAHEFGHTLGLVDLYDTEYEGPNDDSAGIGNWGLMGRGVLGWHGDVDPDGPVPFCAWSRLKLGWIGELLEVTEDMQAVRLKDVALGGKVVKIQVAKYEYFLLENRQPSGSYYDRDIPRGGLLIWHIGPGANWWEENKRADLECADGLFRDRAYPNGVEPDPVFGKDNLDFWAHDAAYRTAHNGNLGDATDVFDGVRYTAFGPETNPASTSNAGAPTGIYVRNIHFDGATAVVDIHPRPVMVITDEVTFLDQNGDGIIEAGEKVSVRVRLKNVGGALVQGIQCIFRMDDPYVIIEDSVASFGELPVGDTDMRSTLRFKVV